MIRRFLSSSNSPFRSNVLRDSTGRVILSPEQKEAIEWVKERTAKKEYIDKSQLKITTSRSSGTLLLLLVSVELIMCRPWWSEC